MAVEFVGIELQLRGAKEVYRDMKEIEAIAESLGGKKKIKLGMSELKKEATATKSEIKRLEEELERLYGIKERHGNNASVFVDRDIKKNSKSLRELRQRLTEIKQAEREVSAATSNMGKTFTQHFNTISSYVRQTGSALQTLGNTLGKLSRPFNALMQGTVFAAGYKFLNLMTEGLSGATQRADIMATYQPIMTALAGDVKDTDALSAELEKSIERLNDAVLGLPTGLDEIVDMHKQLTIATQDMAYAERLAIAANNAYLAGGADEAIVTQGKRMLQTLATTGDLTAKQWNSLRKAIPVTWNEMQKEIDGDLTKLSAREFMDLLIDKGINGKTADVVSEMLHTYTAATANIENAFKRMGQNILKTLDEILLKATGKDTIDYIIGLKGVIDSVSQGIQNWIKANPETLTNFLDALKGVNWKSLLEGFGEGFKDTLETITDILNRFKGKDLSGLGKFLAKTPMYAKGLTLLGGAIRGLAIPLGLLGAAIIKIASGKFGGIFGMIGKLFGGGGATGGAIGGAIGKGTFMGIGKIGLVAAEITGIVGAITAMATGFAALDMKFLSSAFNSFKKITENLKVGLDNISQIKASDIDMNGVKDLVKKVSEAYQTLSGIPMSVSVSKRMASSTEHIRNAIWQLRRAAYQINQAAGTTVDSGGFATFVEQIKTALEELNNLSQTLELDIKVTLGAGFASSVKGVVKQITDAKTKIENALKKIPTAITRNVSVTITATVNARQAIDAITAGASAVKGAVPLPKAMGGVVYRAKGGGVPFKRKGTDTVPAMLTPGEYVHNKRAVSAFGIDFMRKVNNLDMKGAMNELMHRAGHMANINRGTSITNNYNNNQKVVINNSNAGAGYTFKTASRFVGAF